MKRINKSMIKFMLEQVEILFQRNIISSETSNKISNYYTELADSYSVNKKIDVKKIFIIILSIISALLIAGGIILLIGYNWHNLNTIVKTVIAYVILLIPMGIIAYFLFFYKKKLGTAFKEGMSLFWALIFPAVISLIALIYKLPSNFEMFIFIWAVSALLILYLFNSISTMLLYIVLIITLTISMQINKVYGAVYYPMYLALIPFIIKELRGKSFIRKLFVKYLFAVCGIVGLGISLEKGVPGLWIIAYINLFILFFLLSVIIEKKEDIEQIIGDNKVPGFFRLFLSPFKLFGILGLIVFAYIVVEAWCWKDIGWYNFRYGSKYNNFATYIDYIVTGLLFIGNIITAVLIYFKRKIKNDLIYLISSFSLIFIIIYVLNSFRIINSVISVNIISIFIILLSGYLLLTRALYRKEYWTVLSVFILLFSVFISSVFILIEIDSVIWTLILPTIFVIYYIFGKVYQNKYSSTLFLIFKLIGIFGICIIAFLFTFEFMWDLSYYSDINIKHLPELFTGLAAWSALLLVSIAGIFLKFKLKLKTSINYVIFGLSIIIFTLFLLDFIFQKSDLYMIFMWIGNFYILALCLFGFYLGIKNKQILPLNYFALFLIVTIIFRFFHKEMGLLFRGIAFIISGIILLILNIILNKKLKEKGDAK